MIISLVIIGAIVLWCVFLFRRDRRQDWDAIYDREFIKQYLKGKG